MPRYIFRAKTLHGYSFKILFELLQNNFKTGCFRINKKGLFLRMTDSNRKILVDVSLDYDKFNFYKFSNENELIIGFSLDQIHKLMKAVRKKDSIVLYISRDNPNKLSIKVIPNENTKKRTTEFGIGIQTSQNVDISLPEDYDKFIMINSNEFQKACKEITSLSPNIKVIINKFIIKFFADGGNVYDKETSFGENNESDIDSDDNEDISEDFDQNFDSDQLLRISKISGLCTYMQIFPKKDNPLLFKSNVGQIGQISIFIKSKELQERDNEE